MCLQEPIFQQVAAVPAIVPQLTHLKPSHLLPYQLLLALQVMIILLLVSKQWGLAKSDTANRTITFPVSVTTPLAVLLTEARHDTANLYMCVLGSGNSINNMQPSVTSQNVHIGNQHDTASYWLLIAKA